VINDRFKLFITLFYYLILFILFGYSSLILRFVFFLLSLYIVTLLDAPPNVKQCSMEVKIYLRPAPGAANPLNPKDTPHLRQNIEPT
jgi:hypothetical protein